MALELVVAQKGGRNGGGGLCWLGGGTGVWGQRGAGCRWELCCGRHPGPQRALPAPSLALERGQTFLSSALYLLMMQVVGAGVPVSCSTFFLGSN